MLAVKHEVMGFFSSRRPEQPEEQLNNDSPVVRVIRSRFYGKQKGKEREVQQDTSSSAPSHASSVPTSPLHSPDDLSLHDSGSPRRYQPASSSTLRPRPPNLTITTDASFTSTDAITITLAQRLNELAVANSQGLLDDDEYRLLRQSLFERLAAGSSVPSEASLVPVTASPREKGDGQGHQRRSSSSFQGPRTPSLASKKSFTSTVSGFLKRASSKRRTSALLESSAVSDTGSVMSNPKTPDRFTFSLAMSKQQSDNSLRTEHSRSLHDPDTFSSRHSLFDRTPASAVFRTPEKSRTIRRAPSVPPSSFPGIPLTPEAKYAQMSIIDTLEDDERLQTSAEIRQEIEHIEAEGRRLLDAFNGLELSTLVRQHRRPGHAPLSAAALLASPVDAEHQWKHNVLSPSASLRTGKDPDAMSVMSSQSGLTGLSRNRSPSVSRIRQLNTSSSAPVFQPVTLNRKTSLSSISSRTRSGTTPSQSLGRFGFGSTSSVNLSRSSGHLPLATVSETESAYVPSPLKSSRSTREDGVPMSPEGSQYSESVKHLRDDEDIVALEAEMADIRKRRAEVTARYEARLEYLRARLKGAELREKLLKR